MEFIYLISFLFASGLGFGLSFWIYGTLLDKSNNIGDSKGERSDYDAYANFSVRKDRMSRTEKESFSAQFAQRIDNVPGPQGNELVRRMSKEEIENYKKAPVKAPSGSNVYTPGAAATASASPVKVTNTEAELREWEKNNAANSNTQSPFKPL